MFLLSHSEDRVILSSFVWVGYQRVTNRQMDGRYCRSYYSALRCGRAVKHCCLGTPAYFLTKRKSHSWLQSVCVSPIMPASEAKMNNLHHILVKWKAKSRVHDWTAAPALPQSCIQWACGILLCVIKKQRSAEIYWCMFPSFRNKKCEKFCAIK